MTNRIAIALLILLAVFFTVDYLWLGFDSTLFLARRFVALVEYVAFWR